MKSENAKGKSEKYMKPVTVWERWNKEKQKYEHNHIEDGHLFGDTPVAKSKSQKKSWEYAYWRKKWAYMIGSKIVKEKEAY